MAQHTPGLGVRGLGFREFRVYAASPSPSHSSTRDRNVSAVVDLASSIAVVSLPLSLASYSYYGDLQWHVQWQRSQSQSQSRPIPS